MNNYSILCLLPFLLISCNNKQIDKNKVLFNFYTSFHGNYACEIDLEKSTLIIKNEFRYYYQSDGIRLDSAKLIYEENFHIQPNDLNNFVAIIDQNDFHKSFESGEDALDGVGFSFTKFLKNGDEVKMQVINPERNSKYLLEYNLLDNFFDLSYKTVYNHKDTLVLETIQEYFDYGLALKETNTNPLEYRVFGSISGDKESNKKIVNFFDNLPPNNIVIFDIRDHSFSYALRPVILEYAMQKKIYFYGSQDLVHYEKNIKQLIDNYDKRVERNLKSRLVLENMKYENEVMKKFTKRENEKIFYSDKRTLLEAITD